MSGGFPNGNDEPPARGSTPVGLIEVCQRLVVQAGVALRAVPRVLGVVLGVPDATRSLPEATSVRWWLLRLGLFALREALLVADDWVYLIDHSVQIGNVKVCVILGLRLRDVPFPARALRHDDVRVLAVIPVEHSTGEVVAAQLEQAAQRTGNPRQIVSDHGSDIKKGSELFAERHPGTAVTYDAAHHDATVLQRRFTADPRWSEFVSQLSQVKPRIQQTSDAFLLAPSLRPKARFMNDETVETEMVDFTHSQSQAARPGERLVASTEVLESVFGKWKALERQESRAGITSFVLSLGSLVGQWPTERIQAA